MRFLIALLALCLGLSLFAVPLPFSQKLLEDPLWQDGKAEISLYVAKEKRYGRLYEAEVRHIVVREPFSARELVKADSPQAKGAYPVFKLNQIVRVPVGTYRYDQMHSSFWRAKEGELIKASFASIDSCGNTYKQVTRASGGWNYLALTYWEGMSEVEQKPRGEALAPRDGLFYDELPFKLRTLDFPAASQAAAYEAPLMASIFNSRSESLAWKGAVFRVTRDEAAGWVVRVRHAKGDDRFVFDAAFPHALKTWKRWDGSELELRHRVRLAYWELNQPGEERRLEPPTP